MFQAIVSVTNCFFNLPNPAGSDSLVCANRVTGHTCSGDSGGFVGQRASNGRFVVDAVVSFGPASPVTPVCPVGTSGHTSVGFFLQWILDTANNN